MKKIVSDTTLVNEQIADINKKTSSACRGTHNSHHATKTNLSSANNAKTYSNYVFSLLSLSDTKLKKDVNVFGDIAQSFADVDKKTAKAMKGK